MIRFRFQPTFADWRTVNFIWLRRQLRVLVWVSGVLVFCYLALPLAQLAVGREAEVLKTYAGNLGVLLLPAIVALFCVGTFLAVRRRWKTVAELRIEREYAIDETGVRVTGPGLEGFLEWQHFESADLDRGYCLLKTRQLQFHFFPLRAAPDPAAVLALVARHVEVSRAWKRAMA
jgi:hypothetical protein